MISTADQLLQREHYAADEIEARCAELQQNWDELISLSTARHQSLQDSLKAQQVREKENVLTEKASLLAFTLIISNVLMRTI